MAYRAKRIGWIVVAVALSACSVIVDSKLSDKGEGDGGPGVDMGPGAACFDLTECDDHNPCNGEEICNAGMCRPGTALELGHSCDADNNPATLDICGMNGTCAASTCGDGFVDMMNLQEICDDGNAEPDDGCEPGCRRFSCTGDPDCPDPDVCNGNLICDTNMHMCVRGSGDLPAECSTCTMGTDGARGICVRQVCSRPDTPCTP